MVVYPTEQLFYATLLSCYHFRKRLTERVRIDMHAFLSVLFPR